MEGGGGGWRTTNALCLGLRKLPFLALRFNESHCVDKVAHHYLSIA